MRRVADGVQISSTNGEPDFGDDKTAAAKAYRRTHTPSSPTRPNQQPQQHHHWEWQSSVLVGLPWGLVVCLLWLMVYSPSCRGVPPAAEAEPPSEVVQLRRGDYVIQTVDRIPKAATPLTVVLEGREWLLLAFGGDLQSRMDEPGCKPLVTGLPVLEGGGGGSSSSQEVAGGQLFQVQSGEAGGSRVAPTVGREILQGGVSVRHGRGWLLYRSMEAEICDSHGHGHCTDSFTVEMPCASGAREVRINVVSPSPMEVAGSGMLKLSGAPSSSRGLRAGDGATRLEGLVLNQEAAQGLGLDFWELSATALGGKVTLDDAVRPHLNTAVTGIQEVHEGEHGLVARGSLVGMRLLLLHLVYAHGALRAGEDMVSINLAGRSLGGAPPKKGFPDVRAEAVMFPVKVSVACDAAQSQVTGSGLVKGKPLIYVDVNIQCYDTTGVIRTSGGDNVTLTVRSGNAFEQQIVAQDRRDGTYTVRFIRPNAPYDMELIINGQLHDKGPYFVTPDKLANVRPAELPDSAIVSMQQQVPRVPGADPRSATAQQAMQSMGRRGMGTPVQEAAPDSKARRDYEKYMAHLQDLKDHHKYETKSGQPAPNSRGHEGDIDTGAFGFGELDTDNRGAELPEEEASS